MAHFEFRLCHFTVKCVATRISVTVEWILLKLGILRERYAQIVPIFLELQIFILSEIVAVFRVWTLSFHIQICGQSYLSNH